MFLMNAFAPCPANPASLDGSALGDALAGMQAAILRMKATQLAELARMRAVGMACVEQLDRRAHGGLGAAEEAAFAKGSRGIITDFVSVARAVRQIMVLEQELAGLRPARRNRRDDSGWAETSDRSGRDSGGAALTLGDDTGDYYDTRPVGVAVGWIRETLRIDAPAADPFMIRPRNADAAERAAPAAPETAKPVQAEDCALAPSRASRRQAGRARWPGFQAGPSRRRIQAAVHTGHSGRARGLVARGPP